VVVIGTRIQEERITIGVVQTAAIPPCAADILDTVVLENCIDMVVYNIGDSRIAPDNTF